MARKNNNAGQPNRVAQVSRRRKRVKTLRDHKGNRMVLGPLSDHLIKTDKPTGELVETTRVLVGAA